MEDLSLHILDIAENSVTAGATRVEILINEDAKNDLLTIEIKDNGRGMDEETLKKVHDPFFTTKTVRRVGLGIPFLAQAAREAEGDIEINSKKGAGTHIKATFKLSHIDRKPLGNIEETLKTLIIAYPEVNFVFEYKAGDLVTRFNSGSTLDI